MIDCGEGTQLLLKKYKIKLSHINTILISHLHGDHYYGLMGLLSTLHLYGRKQELHLFGPPGLSEIVTIQLRHSQTVLAYEIIMHEWVPGETTTIYDDEKLSITTLPLDHRVPCCGYLFREKPKKRRINRDIVPEQLPPNVIRQLKDGQDVYHDDGTLRFAANEVTLPPKKPFSYAYCSDTRYMPDLAVKVHGVDVMYHESTFMEDMRDRAVSTYHSTAAQAAQVAKDAEVGLLLLGHFSTRYRDLNPMLHEARAVFPNTELGEEGKKFVVNK